MNANPCWWVITVKEGMTKNNFESKTYSTVILKTCVAKKSNFKKDLPRDKYFTYSLIVIYEAYKNQDTCSALLSY
jgi:hypothetical protein